MRPLSEESPRPDPALVAAYRSGDEGAAAELVQRHAGALRRYLYGLGADSSDLEDLVQETFFKAFRALDGFRGDATFRGWLFRIGANLRKDWYRRQKGPDRALDRRSRRPGQVRSGGRGRSRGNGAQTARGASA